MFPAIAMRRLFMGEVVLAAVALAPCLPASAAPAAKMWIVDFSSEPYGAEVSIDGAVVCAATPCTQYVPQGRHKVSMSMTEHVTASRDVTVGPGGRKFELKLKAEPGINAEPANNGSPPDCDPWDPACRAAQHRCRSRYNRSGDTLTILSPNDLSANWRQLAPEDDMESIQRERLRDCEERYDISLVERERGLESCGHWSTMVLLQPGGRVDLLKSGPLWNPDRTSFVASQERQAVWSCAPGAGCKATKMLDECRFERWVGNHELSLVCERETEEYDEVGDPVRKVDARITCARNDAAGEWKCVRRKAKK
jgi:hypothetical protein